MTKFEAYNDGITSMKRRAGEYTIFRMKDLTALLKRSRSMIYLDIDPKSKYYNPAFPKPIRLSAGTIGWKAGDVYDYIDALVKNGGNNGTAL